MSVATKIIAPATSRRFIASLGISTPRATFLLILAAIIEALIVILIVIGNRLGLLMAAILCILYSVLLVIKLIDGSKDPCNCLPGDRVVIGFSIWHVVRALVLAILGTVAYLSSATGRESIALPDIMPSLLLAASISLLPTTMVKVQSWLSFSRR